MAVTSLLGAVLAHAIGPQPELAVWLLITPPAIALAAIDLAVHRLPDAVTLPLAVTTAALLGITALLPTAQGSWTRALLGAVAFAGGYFALFLISPNGIGFGDVKLALTIGLVLGWHGWDAVLAGAFAGQLLAVLHGLVLAAAHKTGRKTQIPFGPGMLGGAYTTVLLAGIS
ncbi:A24 family peptidase [Streptomyces sp. LHD-70]|uniref:A24 family peptidase n=1 Tax=Streptomyces sp. LHD-70 TaxID=3072140 RepID=UPI00280DBDF1|nr:A24 family peptidase [Streptomyces sp. LHD-70]MDQ8707486.1 A24 family peptidase [Streptomyces sp. LHD-70]